VSQSAGKARNFNDGGFGGVSNRAVGQAVDGIGARDGGLADLQSNSV